MAFYNEKGERIIAVLDNGSVIVADPAFINFTGNVTVTPNADGVTVNILGGGTGSPGGLNTQVQYNNNGVFGGISGATTNGTIVSLTNPLLGGATLTTSSVNGVTLTTGGSTSSFLNANGVYSTPAGAGTVTSVASADGSITVTNPTAAVDLAVVKAPKWSTGRTVSITGDLAYTSPSFDGSGNVTASGTLATVNTNVGSFTYASITVNAKGLITAASNGVAPLTTLTVGSTTITSGTTTRVLFDNAGVLGEYVISGTGNVAMTTSPVFTTPNIGSATGSISGNAGTATALATGRTIAITGDLAYTSPSFDGSGNVTAAGTLATVNGNVGTFGSATQSVSVTVNGKGLVTAISNVTVTPAVGSITGLGTGVATFLATPSSANLASAVTDETGSGALVFATGPTVTLASASTAVTQAPADNSTKIATTAYVAAALLGQDFKEACKYASTAALPSIVYANGSSGVGATLTGVALAAISLDGASPGIGDRVLIKNQVSTFQNGIYVVTQTGSGIAVFILTRSTDFNQSFEIDTGDTVFVTAGSTQATTTWAYNGIDQPVMGTDAITFAQTAGQGSFTAGNGISITGVSIAIDTSVTVDKTTVQTMTNKTLTSPVFTTPVLGTPSSGTGTNITGIPAANILAGSFGAGAYVISTSLQVATIELGAATDTTLSRVSAGVIAVEGVNVVTVSSTDTLTNKRVNPRTITTTQSATPTINTDNTDISSITGLAQAITSFTTNLSGTPVMGNFLEIQITDNGTARGITWGASFVASTVALPTTTVISTLLRVLFQWDSTASKWGCVAVA